MEPRRRAHPRHGARHAVHPAGRRGRNTGVGRSRARAVYACPVDPSSAGCAHAAVRRAGETVAVGGAGNRWRADGRHDEVITALAKIHDLTVISRTSVMAYRKSEGRNLRKIAAELGVASVLEGSVQRAGGKVKVIVQLIDARTDQHLWAETYIE